MTPSWTSPKVRSGPSPLGRAVFAVEPIAKGELLLDSSQHAGRILSGREAARHPPELRAYFLQVEDDRWFVPDDLEARETGDFINHACHPNCGIQGSLRIVALRDIAVGEEITFDYAMTESDVAFTLDCRCGAPNCRGTVTGLDWYRPDLRERYAGHFSAYLERKLQRRRAHDALARLAAHARRMIKLRVLNRPAVRRVRRALRGSRGPE